MTEQTFLILTALATAPMHGYAVIEDVSKTTGGRVKLRAGTLYAALDRLGTEGLIAVDREEVMQSRLRRYYRLTGAGLSLRPVVVSLRVWGEAWLRAKGHGAPMTPKSAA